MGLGIELKRVCESRGAKEVTVLFGKLLKERKIDPYKVQVPDLARAFLGDVGFDAERRFKAAATGRFHALESSEAMDASTFSNITGQLLVTIIKEKYESPEFIGAKLVKTYPNPGGNLQAHKIPYLSDVIDKPQIVQPMKPYPHTSFAESWVTMPAPEKRGLICALSFEMSYSDLTGQAQDSAGSVGRSLAYQKDERIFLTILGAVNPYIWNDNALSTYVSTANAGGYVNRIAASTITNYTHVNSVEQLFYKMVDPITGRKIMARPKEVLALPQKRYELKRILNATETRSGNAASDSGNVVVAPNPLDVQYPVLSSAIAQAILADTTYFSLSDAEEKEYVIFGDFQKAFGYREVYPLKTDVAPALNPMEFNQDIVFAVKASEYGVPFVYDPRHVVLSTSEAS